MQNQKSVFLTYYAWWEKDFPLLYKKISLTNRRKGQMKIGKELENLLGHDFTLQDNFCKSGKQNSSHSHYLSSQNIHSTLNIQLFHL